MTTEKISVHTSVQKERISPKEDRLHHGASFPVSDLSTIISDTKPISSLLTWAGCFPIESKLVMILSSFQLWYCHKSLKNLDPCPRDQEKLGGEMEWDRNKQKGRIKDLIKGR